MVLSGGEVGIQLCFINKMEERSPSCVVSLDMDLFMGPFVVCAVHASKAERREPPEPERASLASPHCSLQRGQEPGARSRARCVGLKLTGQRTGGLVKGQRNYTHCHCPLPTFAHGL